MTRRKDHAAEAFAVAQVAKMHRRLIGEAASTLKARARAARLAGLDSVTVQLPIGDARLIADALTEWGRDHDQTTDTTAHTTRRDRAVTP